MECHEGAKMIKTFRGLMADGAQDTVVLHTNNGKTGYRIVNLQVMTAAPFTESEEHVLKIYKISQTTIDGVVDFSDQTLPLLTATVQVTPAQVFPSLYLIVI